MLGSLLLLFLFLVTFFFRDDVFTGVSWRSFGGGTEEVITLAGSVVEDEVLAPDVDELFMADAADVATASADSREGRGGTDADVSSIDDDARAPSAAAVVADELLDAMGINDSTSALSFGRCGCDGTDESALPPPPPPPSVGGLRQGEGIDGVVVSIGSLEECNDGNDCNANDKVGGRRTPAVLARGK